MNMDLADNANRFTGFADIYDGARPVLPLRAIELICLYGEKQPEMVVDLGCGTGLSTAQWEGFCKTVIGIEPSDDMLQIAAMKRSKSVSFRKAFAHDTGLYDLCADAVICSQSFHWMEPASTLREVNRILRPGGVFATVDCDWPPVCGLGAETAYAALFRTVRTVESETAEIRSTFCRWEKEAHLRNITESGYFRYCRELVFENAERCDADRFIALAFSQGSLQAILKRKPELIQSELDRFMCEAKNAFAKTTKEIRFCYRMRIGVK